MKLLVLNGPNLNMTGRREPEIYGVRSLDEIMDELSDYALSRGAEIVHIQTNHEGALIDLLQKAGDEYSAVLLNAGALTHYSYALRDAIACCTVPVGEVHMSDILSREPFRAIDVIEAVCAFRIMGSGAESYRIALDEMLELISK